MTVDFVAGYSVASLRGAAFSPIGYATEQHNIDVLVREDDHELDTTCGYTCASRCVFTGEPT